MGCNQSSATNAEVPSESKSNSKTEKNSEDHIEDHSGKSSEEHAEDHTEEHAEEQSEKDSKEKSEEPPHKPANPSFCAICYSCGDSLPLEEFVNHDFDKCIAKQREYVSMLPKAQQGKEPQKPKAPVPSLNSTLNEVRAWNFEAMDCYELTIATCFCGDRCYPKHFKEHADECDEFKRNMKAAELQSYFKGVKEDEKYKHLVICYMCGDTYTIDEIQKHQSESECPAHCEALRNQLPEEPEGIRGKPAEPPSLPLPGPDADREELNAYNKAALDAYRESLCVCYCGKKIDLNKMKKHLERCSEARH